MGRYLSALGRSVAAACGWLACPAVAQVLFDPSLDVDTLVEGLEFPTAIAMLGPNDWLVCEKNTGRVLRVRNLIAESPPVLDLPVNTVHERGLLGIALHPGFPATGFVYVYYSLSSTGQDSDDTFQWSENRLCRFAWDGQALSGETVLMSIPLELDQGNGANHDGGVTLFGPDDKLYVATGDLNRMRAEQNNPAAADLSARTGGIYRLNDDGSVPADNPFVGLANPLFHGLFAYGVRNCFGLAFDDATGRLWDTENGPEVHDEVNLVERGFNSGWTPIMGPDSRDPEGLADLVMFPGAVYSDPEFSFVPTVGITSIVFVNAGNAPESLRETALVADYAWGDIHRFRLNPARDAFELNGPVADRVADGVSERESLRLGTGFNVTTDLKVTAAGEVLVLGWSDGVIRRIRPACAGDVNGDRTVSLADLTALLGHFGTASGASRRDGDLDGDADVDLSDLTLLLAHFGATC